MENKDSHRQTIGQRGEDAACRFLEEKGHTVIERNWRSGHLEIDIITIDADGIHFVEVKARQKNIQAPPQENVDRAKQRKVAKAAGGFLRTAKGLPYGGMECFFDVVAVTFGRNTTDLKWFPQAYIPIYL